MFRYFLYSILTTTFLGLSVTIASDDDTLLQKPQKSCGVKDASEQQPFRFNDFVPDMKVAVSCHLSVRDYACLLLTNKELANTLRNHPLNIHRKPIPFGEGLLIDISDRLAVRSVSSWHNEICCRLVHSFNPVFGAQVTWDTFPDALATQRNNIYDAVSEVQSSPQFRELENLATFFHDCEKKSESLSQDISMHSQSINRTIPLYAGIYLTKMLNLYFKPFVPKEKQNLPAHTLAREFTIAPNKMLHILQWAKDSIDDQHPVPFPQVKSDRENSLRHVDLLQAVWMTKFCHDEFSTQLKDKTQNRNDLYCSLKENYEDRLMVGLLSLTSIPCQSLARTMNGWLSEIYYTDQDSPKGQFCSSMHDLVRTLHGNFACDLAEKSNDPDNKAFYYSEAAALAPDPQKKAEAYHKAAFIKSTEAKLLDNTTDRPKKIQTLSDAAFYYQQAAQSHTDRQKKAEAYRQAAGLKLEEANLCDTSTKIEKRVRAIQNFKCALTSYAAPQDKAEVCHLLGFHYAYLNHFENASEYFKQGIDFSDTIVKGHFLPIMQSVFKEMEADERYLKWVEKHLANTNPR